MERCAERKLQTQQQGDIFLISVGVRNGDRAIAVERERQMKQ
jgi:hypothetical protein